MASTTKTAVIGIGALFVGALAGGVIGAWVAPRVVGPVARPVAALPGGGVDDGAGRHGETDAQALSLALGTLTREVRGMREAFAAQPSARTSPEGVTPELERLAELLDQLTTHLEARTRPGTSPGYQGAPLHLPQGEPARGQLADLADLPEDERRRIHRFLTYQQVLDRFGRPDVVTEDGIWIYDDPLTNVEVHFLFRDGLVTNVY